ncbi:helix-turn-helix transcriptional regulator [Gordoniibacillus kamchatkensis]|uniref:helix-turn-helix transcriptional regulator n=1 Tax=Gordoniibacillus kamchatkensis TaxID=1590651 RepID=UPI0006987400|nr:AraC family transcriptional regulator [Paenibacillus sp. VKM B-2647]
MLLLFSKRFGNEKDLPVYIADRDEFIDISTLTRLYEPPLLVHLFEAGHWDAAREKLEAILNELEQHWAESAEHITEAFFTIFAAFSYTAHKKGQKLSEMIDSDYTRGKELQPSKTVKHLSDWVWSVFGKIRHTNLMETSSARMFTVKEVQKYIISHLSSELSLQSVSDHLQMHPAYVSRLYKLETGENISNYITNLKMQKSQQLLKSSTKKIYEIAIEVGYQNPHYFIKLFKKYFGMTPQEYRNSNA